MNNGFIGRPSLVCICARKYGCLFGSDGDARLMSGVITDIELIRGGLQEGSEVKTAGTATATAAIWLTGSIGIPVDHRYYKFELVLYISEFLSFNIF